VVADNEVVLPVGDMPRELDRFGDRRLSGDRIEPAPAFAAEQPGFAAAGAAAQQTGCAYHEIGLTISVDTAEPQFRAPMIGRIEARSGDLADQVGKLGGRHMRLGNGIARSGQWQAHSVDRPGQPGTGCQRRQRGREQGFVAHRHWLSAFPRSGGLSWRGHAAKRLCQSPEAAKASLACKQASVYRRADFGKDEEA
jgi:hypothetical protein